MAALTASMPQPRTTAPPLDRAAITAAYDEHAPGIFRLLRRLGVPAGAVDDAVQDVFLVAWRRHADFEGRSSTRTWLCGIALRVARDHRNARDRRLRESPELELAHPSPTPESLTAQTEAVRKLDALLAGLNEPLRETFVLIEIEQLSAPEVATLLQTPLNTIYSRLRLAREAIVRAMRPHASAEVESP
jgi:RNA polymerase sigma-70 factor (ECF subfamily)